MTIFCHFFLTASFKSLAVKIPSPLEGRPERWPPNIRDDLKDFFRSDHFHFWNANPSLPAVFITDTANFRGYMKQCYHQSCDDINHVTPDMIAFLARTTESLVAVASKMTNEKCETKQAGMVLYLFVLNCSKRGGVFRNRSIFPGVGAKIKKKPPQRVSELLSYSPLW